jgi:hypothetical protein
MARRRSRSAIATVTNNNLRGPAQSRGLVLSASGLVEIVELPDHPWFLSVQFHPELRSRPHDPHPLFVDFVRAALERRRARLGYDDYTAADREAEARAAREQSEVEVAGERTGQVPRPA